MAAGKELTRHRTLANEANERGVGGVAESESGTHCDCIKVIKGPI